MFIAEITLKGSFLDLMNKPLQGVVMVIER